MREMGRKFNFLHNFNKSFSFIFSPSTCPLGKTDSDDFEITILKASKEKKRPEKVYRKGTGKIFHVGLNWIYYQTWQNKF